MVLSEDGLSTIEVVLTYILGWIPRIIQSLDEWYYQLTLAAAGQEHRFFLGLFGLYFWLCVGWTGYKVASYTLYRTRIVISSLMIVLAVCILILNPTHFSGAILLLATVAFWQCYSMSGVQDLSRTIWGVVFVVLWFGALISCNWSQDTGSELFRYTWAFLVIIIVSKSPIRSETEKEVYFSIIAAFAEGAANHGVASLASSGFKDKDGKSTFASEMVFVGTLAYVTETRPFAVPLLTATNFGAEEWDPPTFKPPKSRKGEWILTGVRIGLAPLWMISLPFFILGFIATFAFAASLGWLSRDESHSIWRKLQQSSVRLGQLAAIEVAAMCDYVLSQPLLRLPMEGVGWPLFWSTARKPQGLFKAKCLLALSSRKAQLTA